MNSIHDLGGMDNFGPVRPPGSDRVFSADWQKRVHGFSVALGAWRRWNIDTFRQEIERLPPVEYLSMSYHQKWLHAMLVLSVKSGLLTREEADTGRPDRSAPRQDPPLKPGMARQAILPDGSLEQPYAQNAAFAVGDAVVARNMHPAGHTRLPRYVRGKPGTVIALHGAHLLPDSNAAALGEAPQPLYSVEFAATALWGEQANPNDSVTLNLWESYLAPA